MMLFPLGQNFAPSASRRMLRVQVGNGRHLVAVESLATAAAQESLATAAALESLATAATVAQQESLATAATVAPEECMATGAILGLDRRNRWLVRGAPFSPRICLGTSSRRSAARVAAGMMLLHVVRVSVRLVSRRMRRPVEG